MKATDERLFYPDDPGDNSRQISKIKSDFNDIYDAIEMMQMLIRTNQIHRLCAYLPDLKAAFTQLENHISIN